MIHCCSGSPKLSPWCCFEKASHLWHQFSSRRSGVRCRRLRVRLCICIFVSSLACCVWVRRPTRGGKSTRVAVKKCVCCDILRAIRSLSQQQYNCAFVSVIFSKSVNVYSKMMGENPCMKHTACLYTEKIWYRNNFHSEIACKVHRSLQSNTELNVTSWNGVFLLNAFQKSIT